GAPAAFGPRVEPSRLRARAPSPRAFPATACGTVSFVRGPARRDLPLQRARRRRAQGRQPPRRRQFRRRRSARGARSVCRTHRDVARMILKRALVVIAALIAVPYARGPVYRFPPPVQLTGAAFLNPYSGASGHWTRANLHAHGRAWSGFTNGRQSADEIVEAYHRLGYPLAGVSDYQHIAARDGVNTLPVYEHGYSLGKR